VFCYHYLKYVSLPRGHQSAVNIADILLQNNGNQTSRYTKMLRLGHILCTTRVNDIQLRTICNVHHNPLSISPHHGQFTHGWMLTDYLCHGWKVALLLAPIRGYWMVWRAIVLPSIGKGGVTIGARRVIQLFKMLMAMHTAEPPRIRNPNTTCGLNFLSEGEGSKYYYM